MSVIGTSVGEWNNNVAFAGRNTQKVEAITSVDNFYISPNVAEFVARRKNRGGNYTEYRERQKISKRMVSNNFSAEEINRLWQKYKLEAFNKNWKTDFERWSDEERLLEKYERDDRVKRIEEARKEEEKQQISDLNLFPKEQEEVSVDLTDIDFTEKPKSNTILYVAIGGLVLAVGTIILLRKRK